MAYLKLALALLYAAGLLAYPGECAAAAREAMAAWAESVAPALFPFAAVMPFLTCAEARRAYDRLLGPAVRKIFRLPGGTASAIATGLVSGSPGGALATARVAAAEGLTKGQAARLAGIACGVSPVYALSVMGVALNGSRAIGWKLAISQLAAQLAAGFIFSRIYIGDMEKVGVRREAAADRPVMAAITAVLRVCGYMVAFSVGLALAEKLAGGHIRRAAAFIDLPTGAQYCENMLVMAAALGFGGVCIGFQNLAALEDAVKPLVYFAQKLTTALMCAACYWILDKLPFAEMTVSDAVPKVNFEVNLLILMGIMLPVTGVFLRKRSKKQLS